jgi:hypothetical protein
MVVAACTIDCVGCYNHEYLDITVDGVAVIAMSDFRRESRRAGGMLRA